MLRSLELLSHRLLIPEAEAKEREKDGMYINQELID